MSKKSPALDDPAELARMMRGWRTSAELNTQEAGDWLGLSARTIEGIEQGRGFNAPRVLGWALIGLMSEGGLAKK